MSAFRNGGGVDGNSSEKSYPSRVMIKFLLGNGITGSLIGTGGAAIKSLMEITGAKVYVSSGTDHYPGSTDRIILITGHASQVSTVQSLVWHLLANNVKAAEIGERSETWNPNMAIKECNEGVNDDVIVLSRMTIPASAAGMILGRNGSTIRTIAEESGAKISMASKDDGNALVTQERVLTITGSKMNCVKCTSMVVAKLAEDLSVAQFAYRGTSYAGVPTGPSSLSPMGGSYGGRMSNGLGEDEGYSRGGARRSGGGSPQYAHPALQQQLGSPYLSSLPGNMYMGQGGVVNGSNGVGGRDSPLLDACTTISLAVPETLVGNILGRNGTAVREICSLSGAKVLVSPRGEYIEGTTNRLVTIEGSPECAQTAHHFIVQRLQQGMQQSALHGHTRVSTRSVGRGRASQFEDEGEGRRRSGGRRQSESDRVGEEDEEEEEYEEEEGLSKRALAGNVDGSVEGGTATDK